MSSQKPGGFKRGEKHVPTFSKVNQKVSILANWYRKVNESPPGNFLQKVSFWVTLLFTLVTGVLAVISFKNTTEIKGMKEVLSTFKPNIRWVPTLVTINNDTIVIKGHNRNYGTRPAINVISYTYFITEQGIYNKRNDTLGDILPDENYYWSFHFLKYGITAAQASDCMLTTKVVFLDPITNLKDSTYSFSIGAGLNNNNVKMYIASKREEDAAREIIVSKYGNY